MAVDIWKIQMANNGKHNMAADNLKSKMAEINIYNIYIPNWQDKQN